MKRQANYFFFFAVLHVNQRSRNNETFDNQACVDTAIFTQSVLYNTILKSVTI
jgi:hypothetical protein